MNDEIKILVVDDEPFNLEIMQDFLSEHYSNVLLAEDAQACLKLLESSTPDLFLLDVSMPGMDGYELCEKILARDEFKQIPVIFVSARGSAEERLKGYEVGAVDYVLKPFEEEELHAKIKRTLGFVSETRELESSLEEANQLAFDTMVGQSEMGQILQFCEQLFDIDDLGVLRESVLGYTSSLGLSACIYMPLLQEQPYLSDQGICTPLEIDLMQLLSTRGRIFSFKERTQFNFEQVQILIKNMPVDDEARYGRVKDMIPLAMKGVDACAYRLLDAAQSMKKKQIQTAISELQQFSHQTESKLSDTENQIAEKLQALQEGIESKLAFMGLDDDQEELLIKLIDSAVQSVKVKVHELEPITRDLSRMIETLDKLTKV